MTHAFPNETVTRSLLRYVAVPGLDKPAALITLDNGLDHRKPNTPKALARKSASNPAGVSCHPRGPEVTPHHQFSNMSGRRVRVPTLLY